MAETGLWEARLRNRKPLVETRQRDLGPVLWIVLGTTWTGSAQAVDKSVDAQLFSISTSP